MNPGSLNREDCISVERPYILCVGVQARLQNTLIQSGELQIGVTLSGILLCSKSIRADEAEGALLSPSPCVAREFLSVAFASGVVIGVASTRLSDAGPACVETGFSRLCERLPIRSISFGPDSLHRSTIACAKKAPQGLSFRPSSWASMFPERRVCSSRA